MAPSTAPSRQATTLASALGIAVAGGLVAAVPAVVAWTAIPYVASWLGAGPVDATWNDGDAAIAFTAAALVGIALAAVALSTWLVARRFGTRPGLSALAAVVIALGVAILPLVLLLARH